MAGEGIKIRSISLPTRLPSDNPKNFESELEKLKSLRFTTSQDIQSGVLGLAELYHSVVQHTKASSVQKLLIDRQDESVELIDTCNVIREMFQMIRENVQALQSAMRRKGLDSSVREDISSYMSFRKKMNKNIPKSLMTLRSMENKVNCSNQSENADEFLTGVTISIFRSILVYLLCPMAKSGGWNLVSRLILSKSETKSEYRKIISEVGNVDSALISLQGRFKANSLELADGKNVQKSLKDLDVCIEGIEEGLEILFRELVRTRVTLLNILTDY